MERAHTNKIRPLKPAWLKVRPPSGSNYRYIKSLMRVNGLSTVCEEARCPNIGECWGGGTATIMLMGDLCTRGCRFCHVKTGNPKGKLDKDEPEKVARVLSSLQLNYIVLTSVNRDDLPDEGAGHFARVIRHIKDFCPGLLVESLVPDFKGRTSCVHTVVSSGPNVFAHNVETVERLSLRVRDPRASYRQSLAVLDEAKKHKPSLWTKSSIMLGLGEDENEVLQSLKDLRSVGCNVVTFGQYLRPHKRHLPVARYVPPAEFEQWRLTALDMGFDYCASGPLVRSSYRAGEFFMSALIKKQRMSHGT